jgi:hypothetical protein
MLETALSKYDAYGERLADLAAHRHSHTALRIHLCCTRCVGHFARKSLCGLCRGESFNNTVATFLESADTATLDVAAEILGIPAANLSCDTRSGISLPMRLEGMGVRKLVAMADADHVGAATLAVD